MARKRMLTWGELRDMVVQMSPDETASPVLLCCDYGYVGIDHGDVKEVPKDVDPDIILMGGIRKKDVKPGRRFIAL